MTSGLVAVGAICALLVLIAVVLGFAFSLRARSLDRWRALAVELGLTMTMTGGRPFQQPEISGHYRGHALRMYAYVAGGYSDGDIRRGLTYTVTQVSLTTSLHMGLRVYREGLLSKLGKVLQSVDAPVAPVPARADRARAWHPARRQRDVAHLQRPGL